MIDLYLCFYTRTYRYALNIHVQGVLNDSSGKDEAESHSRQREYISLKIYKKALKEIAVSETDKIIPLGLLLESLPLLIIEVKGGGEERSCELSLEKQVVRSFCVQIIGDKNKKVLLKRDIQPSLNFRKIIIQIIREYGRWTIMGRNDDRKIRWDSLAMRKWGGKGIIDQRVALDLQRQLDLKFYELNNTGFGD